MAGELQCLAPTGSTVYAQVINEANGQIWNTSGTPAFQAYQTANIGDYDIAVTELGTASGIYTGNKPAFGAVLATIIYRIRAGGSPAETDVVTHIQSIDDRAGSNLTNVSANVVQWLGTAVSTPTVAGIPNVNVKTWNDLTTVALPLIPTTAGRTLDVSAGGEAGLDWANIGSPTTTVNLSGTSTKAVEPTVAGRTLDVSATGEAGVDWANVGTPGSTVNLSATTINLVNTVTTYTGNTVQTGDSYARIGANGVGLTSVALADATSDAVLADAIWNAATASYGAAGSYGLLIETDLDATISSRLASASYTTPPTTGAIATAVWQDSTAGDFTVASSIGKALYINNVAPGGSGGHLISGSNSGTTTLGALTVTGNLTCGNNFVVTNNVAVGSAVTFGTFDVAGATTFSTIATTGTVSFLNLAIAGNFTTNTIDVVSTTTLTGAVTATNASNDIRGVKLAATGLDAIDVTAPTGVASTFREMIVQLWRRFFKKADKTYSSATAGNLKTYADNGTSVLTTSAFTETTNGYGTTDENVDAAT